MASNINEIQTEEIFTISNKSDQNVNKSEKEEIADFETAVAATGFGKFNVMLFVISILAGWSSIFETTTMSYVFPAAQCDLNLSLSDKGLLNAITYLGMITSAFVWGYLCDTLGRKRIICYGILLDAFFVLVAASSQSFLQLLLGKFFGGFIINGPFAALITYLSEMHAAKYRAQVQIILGIIFSFGNLALPLLAWAVLPLNIHIQITESYVIHSWNVFLAITSLPAIISGCAFIFLPETPKFLMTTGRNKKALQIFRTVYAVNTGNSKDNFPVKKLMDEVKFNQENRNSHVTANRTKTQALKEGLSQIKPIILPPHLKYIVLVCLIQNLFIMGLNTLRLWLPQIFQSISDYELIHENENANLCEVLSIYTPHSNITMPKECIVDVSNSKVYINSIIVACVTICGYILASTIINSMGKKNVIIICGAVGSATSAAMYLAPNSETVVALSAIFVAFNSIAVNVVLSVVVDLFPTSLRTMAVALTMMIGRIGGFMGNVTMPLLLKIGCGATFFSISSVLLLGVILCCLLPKRE